MDNLYVELVEEGEEECLGDDGGGDKGAQKHLEKHETGGRVFFNFLLDILKNRPAFLQCDFKNIGTESMSAA